MSLSRSPSPVPGGGWSSPGLDISTSGRSSPATGAGGNGNNVTWESARLKSQGITGYPSFSTQNQGFFTRHMRRISSSLPTFAANRDDRYVKTEKPVRSRWNLSPLGTIRRFTARISRKTKSRLVVLAILLLLYTLFWITRKLRQYLDGKCPRLIVLPSSLVPLEESYLAWWRPKVCDHTSSQRWGRCNGVERCSGMGHRKR